MDSAPPLSYTIILSYYGALRVRLLQSDALTGLKYHEGILSAICSGAGIRIGQHEDHGHPHFEFFEGPRSDARGVIDTLLDKLVVEAAGARPERPKLVGVGAIGVVQ